MYHFAAFLESMTSLDGVALDVALVEDAVELGLDLLVEERRLLGDDLADALGAAARLLAHAAHESLRRLLVRMRMRAAAVPVAGAEREQQRLVRAVFFL